MTQVVKPYAQGHVVYRARLMPGVSTGLVLLTLQSRLSITQLGWVFYSVPWAQVSISSTVIALLRSGPTHRTHLEHARVHIHSVGKQILATACPS